MTEITLKASPENERKLRILRALEEANDRGIERWIWKVLGDWADGYYAERESAGSEHAKTDDDAAAGPLSEPGSGRAS